MVPLNCPNSPYSMLRSIDNATNEKTDAVQPSSEQKWDTLTDAKESRNFHTRRDITLQKMRPNIHRGNV